MKEKFEVNKKYPIRCSPEGTVYSRTILSNKTYIDITFNKSS